MAGVHYHVGKFPPVKLDWERLLPLIGPASAAIARYDGVLHGIPNTQVLLSPLTAQEAVLSSRIEGTHATLSEVLEFEAASETAEGEKRNDIEEILNYRRALQRSVSELKNLPLSLRLVRNTHRELMQGVRGADKTPGEFRKIQNLIGGYTVESARFVPPEPARVVELMGQWEKYVHDDALDKLVQLAIVHAEFEAIHPFLDGNGRTGRLLVPLFLVDKKLLATPCFFISDYLEARRDEYCDRLLDVSKKDDWTGWCEFFLKALKDQAEDNEQKARRVHELYKAKKNWIADKTHSHQAIRALDWFFGRPIFKSSDFSESSGIQKPTATRILRLAREGGLLRELRPASGRRPATLAFWELLDIAEGRSLFGGT